MERSDLEKLLRDVRDRKITINRALDILGHSYESVDFAKIDIGRDIRTGVEEAILAEGKTPEQVCSIAVAIYRRKKRLLVTRADSETYELLKRDLPAATYNSLARTIVIEGKKKERRGRIAVVSAGTSDIPVAEEAAVTAEFLGNRVERIYDVGVAGIHRLFGHLDRLRKAKVVVVVAGMEGALASVVGGLVPVPVVAVPTSVGYGASFGGIASLLSMLNSCAPGVTVVNIDNGYGAGVAASLINRARGR